MRPAKDATKKNRYILTLAMTYKPKMEKPRTFCVRGFIDLAATDSPTELPPQYH